MTSTELELAKTYLSETRTGVTGATSGLSEQQWKFKPAPTRWSIAEIVEHVVAVQEAVLGPVAGRLANAPLSDTPDTARIDIIVRTRFADRTFRAQAPGAVQPTGRLAPSDALNRLFANYDRLTGYLESTPDLRRRRVEALPLKFITKGEYELMDGYQWVLAAGAHTQRHTLQILEVRADPNFPAA